MLTKFHSWLCSLPLAFIGGVVLIALACTVLVRHARSFAADKQRVVATGLKLPGLRVKVALLKAGLETQRMYLDDANRSREEQAQVYILPQSVDRPRVTRALSDIVREIDDKRGEFKLVSLSLQGAVRSDDHNVVPATLKLSGSAADVSKLIAVLEWGRQITTGDAVTAAAIERVVTRTEDIAPASLGAILEFLGSDLLKYASDPDGEEKRMVRDMPSELATDVRVTLLEGGLSHVRAVLSPVAAPLRAAASWPPPLTRITSIEGRNGEWTVGMEVISR